MGRKEVERGMGKMAFLGGKRNSETENGSNSVSPPVQKILRGDICSSWPEWYIHETSRTFCRNMCNLDSLFSVFTQNHIYLTLPLLLGLVSSELSDAISQAIVLISLWLKPHSLLKKKKEEENRGRKRGTKLEMGESGGRRGGGEAAALRVQGAAEGLAGQPAGGAEWAVWALSLSGKQYICYGFLALRGRICNGQVGRLEPSQRPQYKG